MKLTPTVARYEQIARDLRQRILEGEWAPGVTLPGAPAISAEYRVTQSVAQRALEMIVMWRLARTGAGRGTVVLRLHRYSAEMTIGCTEDAEGRDDALGALSAAVEAAAAGDPVTGSVQVSAMADGCRAVVSALVLAAHSGYAADRLAELVRSAAVKGWDLAGAPVTARPEEA